MRTTILLDAKLVDRAKQLTGLQTKHAVVDAALRMLVRLKEQERIRSLRGQLTWEGDLDELRRSRVGDAR